MSDLHIVICQVLCSSAGQHYNQLGNRQRGIQRNKTMNGFCENSLREGIALGQGHRRDIGLTPP